MESKELRIGNHTSKGIVKSFYEHGIHTGMGKTYKFSELEPIKLTEEIFIELGFSVYSSSFENDLIRITRIVNPKQYYYNSTEIKYVHQLQNLYFAITGNELSFN